MSPVKIAINGFGRIGRLIFRSVIDNPKFEIVAINDLTSPEILAHLLKYDSAQGRFNKEVKAGEAAIEVSGKKIAIYKEKDPTQLPWKSLGIDIVVESSGHFTSAEQATSHLNAGAKKVIISAPATGALKTVVFNVNHDILDGSESIISCASCTTNCLAPMAKVLHDNWEIRLGFMTTIHAYTNDQNTLDAPHPKGDLRRSRAAAGNIVPSSTGAAKAIGLVIPSLKGKLDGVSQRVPTITGSLTELIVTLDKTTNVAEINTAMKKAANDSFGYTEDPIVSSDIIGIHYGSLFDATQTKVLNIGKDQMVKVSSWYDNEMSYVSQLVRTLAYFASFIKK